MFGVGMFVLGLLCAILRLGTAYRFAGVTLAITMLIVRDSPAWIVCRAPLRGGFRRNCRWAGGDRNLADAPIEKTVSTMHLRAF